MKRPTSLQKRLSLGLTLGMTLLWLGATAGTWLAVQHELEETFDSALEATAQRILPLAALEIGNRSGPRRARHVATLKMDSEYLTYVVRDAEGQILMRSHDAKLKIFSHRPSPGFTTRGKYRLYSASAENDSIVIEIAEPLAQRRDSTPPRHGPAAESSPRGFRTTARRPRPWPAA